jgi:hypothetical protein
MRNITLVAAALAVMLAGPLTTIAHADSEHDSRIERSDLGVGTPPTAEQQAKGATTKSTGTYDNYDRFRDPQGFPQPGWQNLFNFPG